MERYSIFEGSKSKRFVVCEGQ